LSVVQIPRPFALRGLSSPASKSFRFAAATYRETPMTFKTNYRQQRSERTRIQNERRQEKFQKRQEAVAKRKAVREEPASADEFAKEG
jgi:hypothetical protein